jgi:hypothetical protein
VNPERVHAEWRNRVEAEYVSAAATAQVLHTAILVGLPRQLLDTAQRIVRDELDHADLSLECLEALGGSAEQVDIGLEQMMPHPSGDGPLADLVDAVVRGFCLGETFAVPLFRAMRDGTTHPAVEPVLTRVLRDESVHRQFGWDALDALLAVDGPGVRARVEARLPSYLLGFHHAYGVVPDAAPVTPWEQARGLIPYPVYARVFRDTVERTLVPWFARRQIGCAHPASEPEA